MLIQVSLRFDNLSPMFSGIQIGDMRTIDAEWQAKQECDRETELASSVTRLDVLHSSQRLSYSKMGHVSSEFQVHSPSSSCTRHRNALKRVFLSFSSGCPFGGYSMEISGFLWTPFWWKEKPTGFSSRGVLTNFCTTWNAWKAWLKPFLVGSCRSETRVSERWCETRISQPSTF